MLQQGLTINPNNASLCQVLDAALPLWDVIHAQL